MVHWVFLLPALFSTAWCCAKHDNYQSHPHLGRRQVRIDVGREPKDWNYDHSADWATIRPEYHLCQSGTHQSPINIAVKGLSQLHQPTFEGYKDEAMPGNFFNWQFAPAWTPHHAEEEVTSLPSMGFDDHEVFMNGWHIHVPSEHLVDGHRSRAEIHLVHVTEEDEEAAVIGIRVAVAPPESKHESAFFKQLGTMIHYNDTSQIEGLQVNMRLAIDEVDGLSEFWTYKGSLTTPPCSEGLRWFIPKKELLVSEAQMVEILAASRFSHRVTQEVWLHDVNL
ncbi:uncharacterized protein Z518_01657 [Rhinocladiella mackenziei CBS 650.93]|uniref:Alpha-carbonic anhydrase domain-containing protein n=1 Tax=Rhinocladiella mackenziei CBS 650.93 TaxID=1442369 RepID=A0A0D2HIU7_9EURO|nr:uncharacterized protein Z518_01657 [Rhinocladiella mackenziei CBS 650.93]KIX10573.1 hypothetical protein Z518_01657 [Rhinocladiella mackenziei CBS 650.93]